MHTALHSLVIVWKLKYLFSAMFPLHSRKNKQHFEKLLCNQSNRYEMISAKKGSHHVPPPNGTLFTVSKDEWYTKEDTGKSIKNALCAHQYAKRHLSGWNNVKKWKIKPIAWSVSQSVSKSVGR